MKVVIQRVKNASVKVEGEIVGKIEKGFLVLLGIKVGDTKQEADYLIKNIFYNKAPLHDGALVIRNNRLYSAGCFLPLSANGEINKELGTRHRAAVGMSEHSDDVVVVVSEETGNISVAFEGNLMRDYTPSKLKAELISVIVGDSTEKKENVLKKTFKR